MIGVRSAIVVADLTREEVMAACLGVDLETLVSRDYCYTQQLSQQIHRLAGTDGRWCFDGICYPSRNNYPADCIALFDRASKCLSVERDIALAQHADWPRFVDIYKVGVVDK